MNWLTLLLGLLPQVIIAVERVSKDVAGKHKKQAVQDTLAAIAGGVATVAPQHAEAAQAAASLANANIDFVVGQLNAGNVLAPHADAAVPQLAVPAVAAIAQPEAVPVIHPVDFTQNVPA